MAPDGRGKETWPARKPGNPLPLHKRIIRYTVHSTQYTVHSTQYTVHSTQYTVHSTQYTVHSTQYTVHSTQYTVHSTQYTVHSTQYTVHSTQYTVHSTAPGLYRDKIHFFLLKLILFFTLFCSKKTLSASLVGVLGTGWGQECLISPPFSLGGVGWGVMGIRIGISIGGYPPYFLHISSIFPPYKNMGGKTPHLSPYSPIF